MYDTPKFDSKIIFFLCSPPSPDRVVEIEKLKFDDLVELDCDENYEDLSHKAMLMYKWEEGTSSIQIVNSSYNFSVLMRNEQ